MTEIIPVQILSDETVPLSHIVMKDRYGREQTVELRRITDDHIRVLTQSESIAGQLGPVIEVRLNPEQMSDWEDSLKIDIGESKIDQGSLPGKVFLHDVPGDVAARIQQRYLERQTAHLLFADKKGDVVWECKGRIEQMIFNTNGNCELVQITVADQITQ